MGTPGIFPRCVSDFVGTYKVCNSYTLPGLPRFGALGAPGLDETHRAFIDSMVGQKARDCSSRSNLNFLVATQWTFGQGQNPDFLPSNVPRIALHRRGAFPQALEAAIRVRNLERILNQPPQTARVTRNPSNRLCQEGGNCIDVQQLEQQFSAADRHPIHERTLKAFWAGYRNLNKAPPEDGEPDTLKATFALTELPIRPRPINDLKTDLSAYLMRQIDDDNGFSWRAKHYVDLQLQLVNYAIFFYLFHSRPIVEGRAAAGAGGATFPDPSSGGDPVGEDASCRGIKMAISGARLSPGLYQESQRPHLLCGEGRGPLHRPIQPLYRPD